MPGTPTGVIAKLICSSLFDQQGTFRLQIRRLQVNFVGKLTICGHPLPHWERIGGIQTIPHLSCSMKRIRYGPRLTWERLGNIYIGQNIMIKTQAKTFSYDYVHKKNLLLFGSNVFFLRVVKNIEDYQMDLTPWIKPEIYWPIWYFLNAQQR